MWLVGDIRFYASRLYLSYEADGAVISRACKVPLDGADRSDPIEAAKRRGRLSQVLLLYSIAVATIAVLLGCDCAYKEASWIPEANAVLHCVFP